MNLGSLEYFMFSFKVFVHEEKTVVTDWESLQFIVFQTVGGDPNSELDPVGPFYQENSGVL